MQVDIGILNLQNVSTAIDSMVSNQSDREGVTTMDVERLESKLNDLYTIIKLGGRT